MLGVESRRPRAGGAALMASQADASSRSTSTGSSGRATIMPASALATSPRPATPARCRGRAPRRCRASTRCAPIWRSGWSQGLFVPPPRPGDALARRARHRRRRRRSGDRRQCDERVGDVGRQRRHGQPRARQRRRQVPPDRRQPAHHAPPQPRMARHAGAASAGLRRRRLRGPRPGADRVRRRGRGQSHAARRRRTARPVWRCSSTALAAAPSPPASMSRRRRRWPGSTGSIPTRTLFAAQSEQAIAAGAFHNDVVAVANGPVLFAHEQAFADKAPLSTRSTRRAAGFEFVEVADADVPLADAIKVYLFNAQLVTPPDGAMTLVAPTECRDTPSVRRWIDRHFASQRADPPRRLCRCSPVDGQWRRPRLPAPAGRLRSRDGRSALSGRRGKARPAGRR